MRWLASLFLASTLRFLLWQAEKRNRPFIASINGVNHGAIYAIAMHPAGSVTFIRAFALGLFHL